MMNFSGHPVLSTRSKGSNSTSPRLHSSVWSTDGFSGAFVDSTAQTVVKLAPQALGAPELDGIVCFVELAGTETELIEFDAGMIVELADRELGVVGIVLGNECARSTGTVTETEELIVLPGACD